MDRIRELLDTNTKSTVKLAEKQQEILKDTIYQHFKKDGRIAEVVTTLLDKEYQYSSDQIERLKNALEIARKNKDDTQAKKIKERLSIYESNHSRLRSLITKIETQVHSLIMIS